MIKIDANEVSASVIEFDHERFLEQLKDWQNETKDNSLIYFLDTVFDVYVDCCTFE